MREHTDPGEPGTDVTKVVGGAGEPDRLAALLVTSA
jgi:hypothetical protein